MHKKLAVLYAFFLILWEIPCAAQGIDSLLSIADSLYNENQYNQSAHLYREACGLDSNRFEPFWKLGRSLNFEGETAPRDSQLAIFLEAGEAEKQALKLRKADADAHFQLARALGKIALFKGVFKSASLARQVRKECLRALELDSLHDGAWHILGRWNREVGKKPKIVRIPMGLGEANKKDAIVFMKKAVELRPDYINHHLELGITYMTYDDDRAARAEFEKCLELKSQRPLDEKYKDDAKKYLAELNKK